MTKTRTAAMIVGALAFGGYALSIDSGRANQARAAAAMAAAAKNPYEKSNPTS